MTLLNVFMDMVFPIYKDLDREKVDAMNKVLVGQIKFHSRQLFPVQSFAFQVLVIHELVTQNAFTIFVSQ
jgi:hypothetical protein